MKKTISILVILIMLLSAMSTLAFAGDYDNNGPFKEKHQFTNWKQGLTKEQLKAMRGRPVHERIRVNGACMNYDVPPVIKDGRTLIPVRAITNGLGADVEWDADSRKVTITRDDIEIVIKLEDRIFYVNGEKQELDVPASIISNRTFVPLRFIAQALGDRVYYDDDTGDIDIIGRLETPERPTLEDFVAEWDEVDEATAYKLRLFHESEVISTKLADESEQEYDFEAYMEDEGCYTVRVTALGDDEYLDSKESKPSYPQIVGDECDHLNVIEGVIIALDSEDGLIRISYEDQDDKSVVKNVYVIDITRIIIDGEDDPEFTDLGLNDNVIVTLYQGELLKIELAD